MYPYSIQTILYIHLTIEYFQGLAILRLLQHSGCGVTRDHMWLRVCKEEKLSNHNISEYNLNKLNKE